VAMDAAGCEDVVEKLVQYPQPTPPKICKL